MSTCWPFCHVWCEKSEKINKLKQDIGHQITDTLSAKQLSTIV